MPKADRLHECKTLPTSARIRHHPNLKAVWPQGFSQIVESWVLALYEQGGETSAVIKITHCPFCGMLLK